MKTIKIIMWVIWGAFALLALVFGITWLIGSDADLGWGYILMIASPIVTLLSLIYLLLTKIFPNERLY